MMAQFVSFILVHLFSSSILFIVQCFLLQSIVWATENSLTMLNEETRNLHFPPIYRENFSHQLQSIIENLNKECLVVLNSSAC